MGDSRVIDFEMCGDSRWDRVGVVLLDNRWECVVDVLGAVGGTALEMF